jgi:hypothetical protein
MIDIFNNTLLSEIVAIGTAIVTIASIITNRTNTPKDDGIVRKLYSIIEFLALVNDKAKQK